MAGSTDRDRASDETPGPSPREAQTIESFVAKLQAEGVEAGRKQAEKARAEAEQQARETLRQAEEQAEKIRAEAHALAEETLAKSRTELELAARDAVLRLQEALGRGLTAILSHEAKQRLEDFDFLGKLLHELVLLYVKADFERREVLRINVQPQMREKLISWALAEIGREAVEKVRPSIDLKGTLADAGFEYNCGGSTVEVTRDSVVQTLMEMVGPGLREVLAEAMGPTGARVPEQPERGAEAGSEGGQAPGGEKE